MPFQIHALAPEPFQHLFSLNDKELEKHHAMRVTASSRPGYPCRVSLDDAQVGEELILVHYQHADIASPYRASHAVYIRRGVEQATLPKNEVPELFSHRLLSLRAFNQKHLMVNADVVDGAKVDECLNTMFEDPTVDYIHIHYAKPGCFAAKATRA